MAHGMVHAAAQTVSSVVIRGTPIEEAIREGVIAGAVDAVAQYGANRISEAYGEGTLNIVTHKVAHGVLGAGIAVAQGRTQTHEIMGAAAGGMLGEIIAESLTDIPAITRSAAATIALLTDQDVNIAHFTASNVMNNNFMLLLYYRLKKDYYFACLYKKDPKETKFKFRKG